jgi:hypothetical protein
MIRYSLTCKDGHSFDSWFQNAEAFGALQATRQLACPVCGAVEVEKALMAPAVVPGRAVVEARVKEPADPPSLRDPQMHEGDSPVRAIHGEARPEEARKLIEDGVPVAPLPFLPTRKVN